VRPSRFRTPLTETYLELRMLRGILLLASRAILKINNFVKT
jgi:hypothetical protein